MCAEIRTVERTLGSALKAPTDAEARARQFGRRSVVASVTIPKGTSIVPAMLAIKRPGTGIEPKFLEQVIGKIARRDIAQDQVLDWETLESGEGGTR
jgi:N-acetylneuraminate synthase/N,N'-diacetyllegionaminate synthase